MLQVADGVLEVAHVEPSDAQIAESLSLKRRVLNNGRQIMRMGRRGREHNDSDTVKMEVAKKS